MGSGIVGGSCGSGGRERRIKGRIQNSAYLQDGNRERSEDAAVEK
jgi:hypothetical protein